MAKTTNSSTSLTFARERKVTSGDEEEVKNNNIRSESISAGQSRENNWFSHFTLSGGNFMSGFDMTNPPVVKKLRAPHVTAERIQVG